MVKGFRPNFDDYYQDEWSFDQSMGVGLLFEGVPNNYNKFLDFLMSFSCNPVSSRRILNILEKGDKKFVTVMSSLNFNEIGHGLKELGVTMKVVAPFEYEEPEYPSISEQIDFAVLSKIKNKECDLSFLDNDRLKMEYEKRLIDVQRSIKERPNSFGPYR